MKTPLENLEKEEYSRRILLLGLRCQLKQLASHIEYTTHSINIQLRDIAHCKKLISLDRQNLLPDPALTIPKTVQRLTQARFLLSLLEQAQRRNKRNRRTLLQAYAVEENRYKGIEAQISIIKGRK